METVELEEMLLMPETDRSEEFEQLVDMVGRLDEMLLERLVAHRGFHAVGDRLQRPLENTVKAYREAAQAGVRLAECDITLTADGYLVLCHDSTTERLAKDPLLDSARLQVSDLTWAEAQAIGLLDGSYLALLQDVLDQARSYGSKIVVEIKSGADNVAQALVQMIHERPENLAAISVVMSFDADIITAFSQHMRSAAHDLGLAPEDMPSMLLLLRNPRNLEDQDDDVIEQELDFSRPEDALAIMMGHLERAKGLEGPLEGLYIQLHESMIVDPEVRKVIEEFASRHVLGIWTSSSQQSLDCVATCEQLIELGVRFINTDFPSSFVL
ncbi:Glycerophosphodiester phosphodiesterase 1 [Hondaea fermentalgiana]|uniref:Glycerophosphodiester phosphodiesterase 1 n=1 Tax=Hondaea fermentalgiana TaxID=2315210 RepID=A0A2R5GFM3_9STRA|nr:Glycerophosphodiester phosphodiesterase 1 [Hondaea fermentalgiana]|eukprot:GBG29385.1 Glycerophosphodiester phosphodiesterase 1 [Hondaea fermentalgiana]